jgi:hypothetical protein
MEPGTPVRVSSVDLTFAPVANGAALSASYTWSDEGKPQDGLLVLAAGQGEGAVEARWVDSWHTGSRFMAFKGAVLPEGGVSLEGSYSVPGTPDWGWRIALEPPSGDVCRLRMWNIAPDGTEYPAVEATLRPAL